jgi:hypothetical protein
MLDEKEYLQTLEEFKKTANILLEGFYDLKNEVKKNKKKVDLTKQFSVINLPSKGLYYSGRNKSLLIRYLTAVEEHILCDSFLIESGRGIELLLGDLIMDDINVRDLLLSDLQAILIFLRSTAYGDSVDINLGCPHCGKESDQQIRLSELEFKKPKNEPNENGKYVIFLPEIEMEFVICPPTFLKELEKHESETERDFFVYKEEDGTETKVKKEKSLSLVYNIDSINGIIDKEKIRTIIRKLPKRYVDVITNFISENEVGVDEKMNLKCPFCGEEFFQKLSVGYSFLSLPPSYKENIYEEMFLITYYGKGITRADAMSMPVVERKWHIRRIKEEIDKQNEAEKKAMSKAKSSKGKF